MHEAVAIGKRIGPYEVVAKLGEGGMGAVYRARDTKLGRDVAIKILPDAFASDAERLARFEREARTLASLNHPHIEQIYGVEGQALILELVEGDDLSDVIARGPLPLGDALAIAAQIALALEGAHEAGVIHRDLKPANIKVRADGTVKVLDFGLAKLTAGDHPSGTSGSSALTSPATTGLGVILGTASYMSPEQARGRRVDRRSDLWAFGVVLFEMLSGRRMFGGDTITDVIAAVVTREPDWSTLPSATPLAIRRLLTRCLQKDPARRLRDAADAGLEIEEAQQNPDSGMAGAHGGADKASRLRWPWLLAWAATIVAAVAVGAVALGGRTNTDAPLRILNLTIPAASAPTAVLSPDGQWVAVISDRKIFVKGMRESAFRELPSTAGVSTLLAWSPDSQEVAFVVESSIKRVDLVGSRPRSICDRCIRTNSIRGGAWSKDGVLLLGGSPDVSLAGGLLKIPVNGGSLERVTTLEAARGENSHRYPMFLPDGRRFTFTVRRDNGEHEIRVGDLAGAPPYTIASGFSNTAYADGYLLFGRNETLVALAFDAATGRPSGDPLKVADRVAHNVGTGQVSFSVSGEGTLAFGTAPATFGYGFYDRYGRKLRDVTTQHSDGGGRLSRDYLRAVIPEIDPERASSDVYIVDIATGARSRMTSDPGWEQFPVWSPSGDRVAYRSGSAVYVQQVSGGKPTRVGGEFGGGAAGFLHDWSRDGKYLLLTRSSITGGELVRLSVEDGLTQAMAPSAATASSDARLSIDGRWVAYVSAETGSAEIHVRSFPDGRVTQRITTTGGDAPLWNHDGTELFYRDGEGWVTACRIRTTGSTVETGARERLFKPILANSWGAAYQHDIDATGKFFVFRVGDETGSFANSLTVTQNWTKVLVR